MLPIPDSSSTIETKAGKDISFLNEENTTIGEWLRASEVDVSTGDTTNTITIRITVRSAGSSKPFSAYCFVTLRKSIMLGGQVGNNFRY